MHPTAQDWALARIVSLWAPFDPRAAEQVARSIRQQHEQLTALTAVAKHGPLQTLAMLSR